MTNDSAPNQQQAEQDLWAIPKPDWEAWKTVKQTQLWCAACIASDIDPSHFRIQGQKMPVGFRRYPDHMADLLSMAKSSIGANGILRPIQMRGSELEECEVNLANFATWMTSIKYPLPEGFPWAPEAQNFTQLSWPWGRHSTVLLRNLAEAADRFWKNYDPDDPSSAPTNRQVAEWLEDRGVSTSKAEAIATILRADGLPKGPRK